ncbi:MAG: UvrD-helicase domain-containing protein [Desulfovibrio sp.]|jgi:ATP-dependent exoDNAse (exonuclease V) beta subunit|nr:UvrD-helicase domain-containing protein [Desulfovibrio sp.]
MITRIKASAGAGKTYALTRNFLELLEGADVNVPPSASILRGPSRGYTLQEILAATFTNKAAAEMKDRVLGALKTEALKGPGSIRAEEKKKAGRSGLWVERILRNYSSLNIRTIDSLLAAVVRLSALELGLPPDFELSFAAGEYFTPCYDGLMEDLAEQDTGAGIFLHTDATALRAALRAACETLLHAGDFRGFTPGEKLHDLLLSLVQRLLLGLTPPDTDEKKIRSLLFILNAERVRSALDLLENLEAEKLETLSHYQKFLEACAGEKTAFPDKSVYLDKSDLDECLKKASQGRASDECRAAFRRASRAAREYRESRIVLQNALSLESLYRVAGEIFARLRTGNKSKLLPALCLPKMAADLLSGEQGVSDALCRLGTRLSRIMLDEFQDTSRAQWEALRPLALESLAGGGSLWLVGDAKQAIYGWRGGEAELFEDVVSDPELTSIVPHPETLSIGNNWRSHPGIVDHNNAFFSLLEDKDSAGAVMARLLPAETPNKWLEAAARKTAQIFCGAAQKIPEEKNWSADARPAEVVLYRVKGKSVDEVVETASLRLRGLFCAELLQRWQPGDIAVLVRTADEAEYMAGLLAGWEIPVVTENSFRLFSHPLAGRLVSFLAFLDYPPDDEAFLEFVSGPEIMGGFAGCDPEAIKSWTARVALGQGPQRPPLYTLFRRDFPALWASLLEPFYARAGLMSAYDLLAEGVRRFDLERRRGADMPFVRRLLELAALAERQGCGTPAAFLAFCRERAEDEKLPLPENVDAVRIMTIHKAKGLEFPVVVIPFQHKYRRYSPEIIRRDYHGLDILTRATRELPDDYYPACIKQALERLDLLYVAWTRPVYALHAFFTRPEKSPSPLAEALFELSGRYREKYGDRFCRWEETAPPESPPESSDAGEEMEENAGVPEQTPGEKQAVRAQAPALAVLDTKPRTEENPERKTARTCCGPDSDPLPGLPWRPLEAMPRLRVHRFSHAEEKSPPAAALSPRLRGILLHLCLERLHLPQRPDRSGANTAVTLAVNLGLALFPLPLSDPAGVAAGMHSALLRFALLPDAPLWLAHGLREHEIMDEQGRLHRADLLVDLRVTGRADEAGGGLLVLDYKSGRADNEEAHKEQVRRYLRLVGAASGRPARGLIFYLDEDRLLEVADEGRKA